MTPLSFISLLPPSGDRTSVVGTLGPEGTSSELAATLLSRRFAVGGADTGQIRLFDTYERAGEALSAREVTHMVVANAYKAVHNFYMDPAMVLTDVFVMDTPQYGIARRCDGSPLPPVPRIASHPSPVPIIAQLLPHTYGQHEVVEFDSTSAAARAVADGELNLALTTEPAAELYGLEFVTDTRPIRMVWSVFTNAAAASQSNRVA